MNPIVKSVVMTVLRAALLTPAFMLSSLFVSESEAVSIQPDGTRTLLRGTDCDLATYRFGTTASYNGTPLKLLIGALAEGNEFANGQCVGLTSNLLSLRVDDEDAGDDVGSMDLRVTVFAQDTTTPCGH